jgi:Flp pilus assembly pilin Flp
MWQKLIVKGSPMHAGNEFAPRSPRKPFSLRTFLADEAGNIEAASYILIVTILGFGMICGLTTIRDQFTQAFGDVGVAMATVNQSYTINMTFAQIGGGTTTKSFGYVDAVSPVVTPGAGPDGMQICGPATSE